VVIVSYNPRARPETVTATVVGPAQIKALVAGTIDVPPAAAKLRSILAAGGYVASFNAPTAGTLGVSWTASAHGRRVTVATGASVARQFGRRSVPIELTTAGRALLYASAYPPRPKPKKSKPSSKKHKHRALPAPKPRPLTITATATFTPAGKTSVIVGRRITLR
jgi:hypothetical protein